MISRPPAPWLLALAALAAGCDDVEATLIFEGTEVEGATEDEVAETGSSEPELVCDVWPNPVRRWHEGATFSAGRPSTDGPEGRWEILSHPAGSLVPLSRVGSVWEDFRADLPGTYVARFLPQTGGEPCEVSLVARAGPSLEIELTWTYPGDDMDLHLLAPGGEIQTQLDCYYANCRSGLDWGLPHYDGDNPLLVYDDIAGTGPELIEIPDPDVGPFTVVVHDFPGSVYLPPNPTTVNIYIDGQEVWSGTKDIEGEDDYVYFATIDWPSGQVHGL